MVGSAGARWANALLLVVGRLTHSHRKLARSPVQVKGVGDTASAF
jgi:hypothetical protein